MAIEFSEDARELLFTASQDPDGLILRLTALGGGAYLKSNGRAFGDGRPDDQARWDHGARQLLQFGLIEPRGDQVFWITDEGRRMADVLKSHRPPSIGER